MVKNNELINLINNNKSVELVQELKDYEIKRSSLSTAARSKIIKKSGGYYQSPLIDKDISEIKGYGPCFECDNSAGFRLEINLTTHIITGATNTAIYFRGTQRFIFNGVEKARKTLDEFENGNFRVVNWAGIETDNARSQKSYVIRKLRYYTGRHENGASVNDTIKQVT